MTIEHIHNGGTPSWSGVLPGEPRAYFLESGDGERSQAFDFLATVLLSGDETGGQFGVFTVVQPAGETIIAHTHSTVHEIFYITEGAVRVFLEHQAGNQENRVLRPGDFCYVPANTLHAYRAEGEKNKFISACTGGFERFFHTLGNVTEARGEPGPFVTPTQEQLERAFSNYNTLPRYDQQWNE